MQTTLWILAALAGVLHVLFFCMESLWWTKPSVARRFGNSAEQAEATKVLAFNQGFYNLFLGLGVFTGLFLISREYGNVGLTLVVWNCASMIGAAAALAVSAPRMMRGVVIQALFPLLFLVGLLWLGSSS